MTQGVLMHVKYFRPCVLPLPLFPSDTSCPAPGLAGKHPSGAGDQQDRPLDSGAEVQPAGGLRSPQEHLRAGISAFTSGL